MTLQEWRESMGLTQEQAAKLAFVSTRTWQRWENGETEIPRWLERVKRDIERELASERRRR